MEQIQVSSLHPQARKRREERLFILLLTVLFLALFFKLHGVLEQRTANTEQNLASGTFVNLNGAEPVKGVTGVLSKGNYDLDRRDIAFIGAVLDARLGQGERFENIGELNKKKYNVPAEEAYAQGGESYKKRVLVSRSLIGFDEEAGISYEQEKKSPKPLPATADLKASNGLSISGIINDGDSQTGAAGVMVKLQMLVPKDSLDQTSLTAYVRTGADGRYEFRNLPANRSYELLPLQPGYEFGTTKGTAQLDQSEEFNFSRQVHKLRLLSSRDFNTLKGDGAFIVRHPADFFTSFWIIVGAYLSCFWLLHLVLSWRARSADQFILPLVMVLTGLSLLTLLSLQDPLRDRFLAIDTVSYFGVGTILVGTLLFINVKKFTPDAGLYRMFVFRGKSAANGWPWILVAILLLMATVVMGSGPEGSGVKVNLFGIQPSELVKYLVILFLAGFFALNERFISEYSSWTKRWAFFSFALLAIIGTLLLFLMLGDLGPAIVICFTFIILFSFSRGDFMYMAAFVGLYILCSFLIDNVWIVSGVTFGVLILAQLFKRRQASESAWMALLVITAFLTIDKMPLLDKIIPGPVERLTDRKAIWIDAWNNEVYGGDQVANGLWAISSGGFAGQGTGEGFAKTIPEAHTDMILPAMGEEFGWAGMVCIFMLFLIYLHRAIIIGRQSGAPFLFYLCTGIGISTFIQFLLIAGGSTGVLPLSGVSLPFESYGGSSLVINLFAAGFLLSASKLRGSDVQLQYLSERQDRNLVPALGVASLGIILLVVNIGIYAVTAGKWVAKPSLVADRSGSRMFSYNPRIGILMRKLEAGNLYDRNGRILATSDHQLILKQKKELAAAGVGNYNLDSALHKRPKRFYPFEDEMFFWTGDGNTNIFTGSVNGYFGEYEHAAALRGFDLPVTNYSVVASRYREDRFLPRATREMAVQQTDYSALTPLLVSGLDTAKINALKRRNRDVRLTVDAALQTHIQRAIAADTSLHDNRVSVVIMEAASGDVLASAAYPLPAVNNWDQLMLTNQEVNRMPGWINNSDPGFTVATQPGSTAKVLTAMASFNKLGDAAVDRKFTVSAHERIRTKGFEPDETGVITLARAIEKSNNVYFIKLANEEHLGPEMAKLYMKTGMFLHGAGGYYYNNKPVNKSQEEKWFKLWEKTEFNSPYNPNNIYRNRAKGLSGISWGQGELIATPAAVARMAAGVANNGVLTPNRFALKVSDSLVQKKHGVALTKGAHADLLRSFMIKQSANKASVFGVAVAGKTGTPERVWKQEKINDGWYVFFAPKPDGGNTVVCIRIESTKGSSDAVKLAGNHVIPYLLKKGYIKSIQ